MLYEVITAITRLAEISRSVFTRELEDNFEHRAWLRRWLVLIPGYIDWQTGRQQAWSFSAAEQEGELELPGGQRLRGRLDRIDSGPGGTAIVRITSYNVCYTKLLRDPSYPENPSTGGAFQGPYRRTPRRFP